MLLANSTQIREADRIQIREHAFPGILLMEEAGRLATQALLDSFPYKTEFVILAGPGNNGGDGLVMARHLFLKNKQVRVLLSHDPDRYKGDAKINYEILRELPVFILQWTDKACLEKLLTGFQNPVLIDALLGTGIQSKLRAPISDIIQSFSSLNLDIVAIDLPSGLNADTGSITNEPLSAQHTFTFQLAKICNYVYPAAAFCGKVKTLDIGIWPQVIKQLGIKREILNDNFVMNHYNSRLSNTHKGSFGNILVVGGSKAYAGAIAMTAFAALKGGAGLVTVFAPGACRSICNQLSPELINRSSSEEDHLVSKDLALFKLLLEEKDAVIIGPGMGQEKETGAFLEKIFPLISIPSVWDADALNILASKPQLLKALPPAAILTPHPGEMQRLGHISSPADMATVSTHRLEYTENFTQDYPCTLVLKGAGTIVACSDGRSFINTSGNPGMATAGSGDILSGIIGALIGQGYESGIAAAMGVYLHGKAGDVAAAKYGQEGMLASDIARELRFS